MSMYHVGLAHLDGSHGFEKDPAKALQKFRAAAEAGVGQVSSASKTSCAKP